MKMRVWLEVTHQVPYEVEIDDEELEDFQGLVPETADDVMNRLYRDEGLLDEIMYSMPEVVSGRLVKCDFDVHSAQVVEVEILT